ncbi:hypothetical protein ACET3Z_006027 [Daucus carota]
MEASVVSGDSEAQVLQSSTAKRGGWITFPFIIATMGGLSLACGGWTMNLMVYLIEEFNVKSIDAAQIFNIVNGCTALFPILGAIVADSFLGCFSVIWISSLFSLLGVVLITVTSTHDSLRPPHCETGSSLCKSPSPFQLSILYSGLALGCLGVGGTRYTLGTMGANQFDTSKNQGSFFNWYFFTLYVSTMVSVTALVYIEDSVSWVLGFGLSVLANLLGLIIFVLGNRFYRHVEANGSPFTGLARVIVAAVRKRKAFLSTKPEDYYQDEQLGGVEKVAAALVPTKSLKFLNTAAVKSEADIKSDGSLAKPWRLCTVKQVEDLKALIKIMPLWSTGIFVATPIAIQGSLVVLQALTMDRHIGPHFQIPAGSMVVFIFIFTAVSLTLIDRFLYPTWRKVSGHPPTPLQRIAVGHVLNVLSMAVSAMVESKRLNTARSHQKDSIVPISVIWLMPPLAIVGVGEAFHFPGQVSLYYQEFPASLKTTATAMVSLFIGIAYYLSTAIVDSARRMTSWLPDDINHGRLDNVYWVIVVLGVLNFTYFLVCCYFYEYQNPHIEVEDSSKSEK